MILKKTSVMITAALLSVFMLSFYCCAASAEAAALTDELTRLAEILRQMQFIITAIVGFMMMYSFILIMWLFLRVKNNQAKRQRKLAASARAIAAPHKAKPVFNARPAANAPVKAAGTYAGDDRAAKLRADHFIVDAYYAASRMQSAAQTAAPSDRPRKPHEAIETAETMDTAETVNISKALDTSESVEASGAVNPAEEVTTSVAEEITHMPDTATCGLFVEALRHATGADIALINCGGIRGEIDPDNITEADVARIFPFSDTVTVQGLTGPQLRAVLEHSAALLPERDSQYLCASGITAEVDASMPIGERVVSLALPDSAISDSEAEYIVAANDYIANGGDGYEALAALPKMTEGQTVVQAVLAYIAEVGAASTNTSENIRLLNAR